MRHPKHPGRLRNPSPLLAALLLAGCGATDPNGAFDINASFTVTHEADVCTFLLAAKATDPEVVVDYAYALRAMRLIAPNTWAALIPLEMSRSRFTDSLGLSWPAPVAGQSILGRFIDFDLTTDDGFILADTATVFCEPG